MVKVIKWVLFLSLVYTLLVITGCGRKGDKGDPGVTGATGSQGYTTSLTEISLDPSGDLCTGAGGVEVFAYTDFNGNGLYDTGEPITSAFFVCNGLQGAQGATGATGATGSQGATGATGATGAQGAAGTNATPTTIVNLCPGTTTYPGVFVEIGFCINSQLYAVYSSPVFLTLVPPGTYSSQGLGSACSLTVGPNCTVTH